MGQSLSKLFVHVVFATKNRRPVLRGIESRVEACMTEVLKSMDCPPIAVGVVEDHAHSGLLLSRSRSIGAVVRDLKVATSKWLREGGGQLAEFSWQNGYSAFSADYRALHRLEFYIRNQRQHHARSSYESELLCLLQENGIAYDERFLWD